MSEQNTSVTILANGACITGESTCVETLYEMGEYAKVQAKEVEETYRRDLAREMRVNSRK